MSEDMFLGITYGLAFWTGFMTCGTMIGQGPFWDGVRTVTDPWVWWRKLRAMWRT